MKIVVIAEEQERVLAEKYFPNVEVRVVGVGAVNIIRGLQDLPRETHILNIGYAGSANFEIGQVVQVTEARLNHPNVTYPEPVMALDKEPITDGLLFAPCYTGVDFCLQSDYKDCVFDMELAFICALGFERVTALKLVSDNLSLHDYRKMGAGVERV